MSEVVLDYSGQELNDAIRNFKANYKNTSDGNITSDTVLAGQIGYNAEGKVIGEMVNNGEVDKSIDGITETSYTIPKGYHNGEGTVKLTDDIANEVDSQTDIISQIKETLQGKAVGGKQEQTKELNITENGSYTVEPDEGYTLSSVGVNVDVEDSLKGLFFHTLEEINIIEEFTMGVKRLQCSSLKRFSAPNMNDTASLSYTFYGCGKLSYIDFGKIKGTFQIHIIGGLHQLTTIIFRNPDEVVPLAQTFSNNHSITRDNYTYYCNFYVPKTLLEDYKTATNWSTYADRFRAIEDYPEITGGII